MKIRQLIDATIKAERGLTLVTSRTSSCSIIGEGIMEMYPQAKTISRGEWEIEGVLIRVQVGYAIPALYNVWYV